MNRKLQAQNIYNHQNLCSRIILVWTLFLSINIGVHAQLIVETDECNCQDYPEFENTGRFQETVTLTTTPGITIKVTDFNNFYDITSPDDMFLAYPDSFQLTEGPPGEFSLTGLRREGLPWSMVINEITLSDTISTFIQSSFICAYPDSTIYGDLNTCIDSRERYSVDLDMDEINEIEWQLSGGGEILGPVDSNVIIIDWGDDTGTFTLSVVAEAVDGTTESNQYCEFESSVSIELVDEVSVTMACTNEVNLSIDGLCQFMVTPELVLKSFPYPSSSFDVELTDLEADTIVNGNMIYGDYIGKRLGVSIIHDCSKNSCWGTILLKDEVAPPLLCPPDTTVDCEVAIDPMSLGFPVPESTFVEQVDFSTFIVTNYGQCGPVTLTFKDEHQPLDCDSELGSLIKRTWTITDNSGNSNFCSFLIGINESEFSAIVFPEDYDDELGTQPSLAACGDWEKLENGAPSPSVTGMPEGAICLNVHVEFEDLIFYKCSEENIDKTFKVWRRWTVSENCPDGMDSVHVQVISVRDTIDPIITVPDTILAGTNAHKCGADIQIPAPDVEECSIWDYKVGYKIKDENGLPSRETFYYNVVRNKDGSYTITDIPGGEKELWVVYTVTDACGNFSIATSELLIMDDEEPVSVCDQYTYVSLDETGVGHAGVKSFDDGSWDNCGVDRLEVRRSEKISCGKTNNWAEKVEFCCNDIGNEVMVSLRVIDNSGNSNTCMVIVEVQDNLPPEFTHVPNDTTIQCEDNLEDLSQYGEAEGRDNCHATIEEFITNNLNDCGLGTIIREFVLSDDYGNVVRDTQILSVTNDLVLNKEGIDFPKDYYLENGCSKSTHPDSLPSGFNYPVFKGNGCTRVTWNFEDQEFIYVEGACRKIIRKWSVIDWCQFDSDNKEEGIFVDYQVIKINNITAPEITSCGDQPFLENLDGCQVYATIFGKATDDCTPANKLKWSFEIDFHDDEIIDRSGTGNNASGILPIGTHRIYWEVMDECENIGYCDYQIEIEDNKAPSPVCLSEIVTVIMEPSGNVDIWASDFDKGSFDNCGTKSNLYFSFTPDTLDASMTFDCEMLQNNGSDTFDVRMYVIDQKLNNDYCAIKLIVQDNSEVCPNIQPIENTAIGGNILSTKNSAITQVEIQLLSQDDESQHQAAMASFGDYSFQDVQMYHNYSIVPSKNGYADEGVSTLDIVKIQRHILGIKPLTSPYEFIAADINNNGKVAASDLIQLRKLVLGIYDHFPSNKSWRFVEANYDFGDPGDIVDFPEQTTIVDLQGPVMDNDFIGIKVGDVDQSHISRVNTSIQTRSASILTYKPRYIDDKVVMDFLASDEKVVGFQFSLNFDSELLEFITIESGDAKMDDSNYSFDYDKGQMLNVSWHSDGIPLKNEKLFSIVFEKIKSQDTYDIQFDSDGLTAEIYLENEDLITTKMLQLRPGKDEVSGFSLLQNTPNPFNTTTKIGFLLPDNDQVQISVFDLTGKLIFFHSQFGKKGINEMTIDSNELGATGVLYYRLQTSAGSISKKMIVIN